MADRKIPRAEDVFTGRGRGGGDASLNVYKNKKAPAPPSGPLPKIGNYQPKSLTTPNPGGFGQEQSDINEESRVHRSHIEETKPKQFIIGDKNTPLEIQQTDPDTVPVAPPRKKRRAPSLPDNEIEASKVSENPLFGRSVSAVSNDESLDVDFEEQGGVMDFGSGGGPRVAYDQRSNDFSNISTNDTIAPDYDDEVAEIDFGIGIDDESIAPRNRNMSTEVRQNGDSDLPYIPPPDYDDEEMTFTFDEEGANVYKEFAGEDYGKYLDDDEDYKVQQRQRGMRVNGGYLHTVPRPANNHRIQGKKYKKKRKAGSQEAETRSTIRDFNFTDTKIGWGDRTVKSTSAKGRYIKREKERNRVDPRTHFNRPQSQGPSYEDFLLGKKDVDSPNSSDSGVDTGEDPMRRSSLPNGESNRAFVSDEMHERAQSSTDLFYHSQPKQMRNDMDGYDKKASMWKRLTWKFKKSVSISKKGYR